MAGKKTDLRRRLEDRGLLNVAHLVLHSRGNGPGLRAVVWLQGCSIRCPGCANAALWPFAPRRVVSPPALIDLIRRQAGAVEGISVSGGEPFDQPAGLGLLLQGAHAAGLSTLVYTGYALADLRLRQDLAAFALRHIDILVDGPYRAVLAEHDRVASSNQAVHFLSPRYPPAILADPHDWPAREILVEGTESILHTGIW